MSERLKTVLLCAGVAAIVSAGMWRVLERGQGSVVYEPPSPVVEPAGKEAPHPPGKAEASVTATEDAVGDLRADLAELRQVVSEAVALSGTDSSRLTSLGGSIRSAGSSKTVKDLAWSLRQAGKQAARPPRASWTALLKRLRATSEKQKATTPTEPAEMPNGDGGPF